MRFTLEQITTIQEMRRSKVPWPVIAKNFRATILECRTALGLQTFGTLDWQALPWQVEPPTRPLNK